MWRENNGCDNCICIGGEVKCSKEVCDITACPSGQLLAFAIPEDCCAVCVDEEACVDKHSYSHAVRQCSFELNIILLLLL